LAHHAGQALERQQRAARVEEHEQRDTPRRVEDRIEVVIHRAWQCFGVQALRGVFAHDLGKWLVVRGVGLCKEHGDLT